MNRPTSNGFFGFSLIWKNPLFLLVAVAADKLSNENNGFNGFYIY